MRSDLADVRLAPVENLAINPSFERVVAGSTIVRRNLAPNPTVADGTGWSAIGGGTGVSYEGAIVDTGGPTPTLPRFYRTTKTRLQTSGSSWLRVQYSVPMAVVAGRTYTFSAYGRLNTLEARDAVIIAIWRNSSAVTILESASRAVAVPVGAGWFRYSVTAVAPAGAAGAAMHLGITSGSAVGESVDATGLLIEERPGLLPFFWGGAQNDRGIAYAWEGTANASASVARAAVVEVMRNYHRNPGARNPSAGNVDFSMWTGNLPNACTVTPSADAAWSVSGKAFQVTWTDTTYPDTGDIAVVLTQATPDTVWTAEWDLVASRTGNMSPPGLYSNPGTWTTIARSTSGQTPITANVPQRRWVTFTADAAALASGLRVTNGLYGKVPGDTLQISNVVIYPGAKRDTAYFDGFTSPDADLTPAWLGAENVSASVLYGMRPGGSPALAVAPHVVHRGGKRAVRLRSEVATGVVFDGEFVTNGFQFGMTPGRTVTILAKMTLDAPQTGTLSTNARRIITYWWNGSAHIASASAQAPNVAGEHLLRMVFTVPASATQSFVRLFGGAVTPGEYTTWDDFAVVDGVYTGPYVDGDLPGCLWRGTPHASTSVGYPRLA
ncbi:hypothetical protein MTE01_28770 [Microbacterium testaceum]|uniref:Minor tail protein n=1 Tax=Microbacterium testaceum TaxID=2033 RepID=A0A4Y3QP66_MICTE|nr:hypothetical protein [Microbacterium testaceum]GEB46932.1 hypothetical protein MTE01_28770 [Microbacterium testaceum]